MDVNWLGSSTRAKKHAVGAASDFRRRHAANGSAPTRRPTPVIADRCAWSCSCGGPLSRLETYIHSRPVPPPRCLFAPRHTMAKVMTPPAASRPLALVSGPARRNRIGIVGLAFEASGALDALNSFGKFVVAIGVSH